MKYKQQSPHLLVIDNGLLTTQLVVAANRKRSASLGGAKHPLYGKRGIQSPNWGKRHSENTITKMKKTAKEKTDKGMNPFSGNNVNLQMIEKGNHPSQIKRECVYCGITCSKSNYIRWHGDRCKHKKESQ